MDLYILRHGIAVPHGAAGYDRDSDRPLTEKGAKKTRQIAHAMSTLGLRVDIILSSPFPRARQTAEIVAKEIGLEKNLENTDNLAVGGDPQALIDEVNAKYHSLEGVMLVGHEPSLSELISVLVSGYANLSITMKKGGLCKLTVDGLRYGRCATLEWLLAPAQMIHIG